MAEVKDKQTQQQNDADRVYKYAGSGFTTSPANPYFHSPYSGRPAPVTIDGKVIKEGTPEWKDYQDAVRIHENGGVVGSPEISGPIPQFEKDFANGVYPEAKPISNGAKNLGSTVPQTTQNNVTTNEMINTQSNSKAVSNRTLPAGVDPIAYRQNYDPKNIKGYDPMADLNPEYLSQMDMNTPIMGANQSFNAYGDDSSRAKQSTLGGMNEKYTGEYVKNSDINYDPNLKIADLNPNYVYGRTSQVYGTLHPGYISQRNDAIASALYNEGLTSKEDVANFLISQKGFYDSSEEDRNNTIESIWKRLGAIQAMQKEPIDSNALMEDAAGRLYGKVTAEGGNPIQGIDTIADANSIYAQMSQARVANVNSLRSMQPVNAATSTYYGTTPYGDQALRDVQNLDPEWYAQYQQELKKLYAQDKADTISHGTADDKGQSIVDSIEETIANDNKNREEKNVNDDNAENATGLLESMLRSNKVASSAKQEMLNIKKDLADLNSELEDLPNKAKKAFKGDVPDYIYQAYISNNRQELQKKIQNLENRYASLADIYKTEVANTQREAEYSLKVDQFNNEKSNDEFNQYIKTAQLELDSIQWGKDKNGNIVGFKVDPATGEMTQITDVTAVKTYNQAVEKVSTYAQGLIGKNIGKQCLGFTNMLTKQTAGVQMLDKNNGTNPSLEERIEYATNPNVSDVIPIAGDVAVMKYNGTNGVNMMRGHVMYVDKVYNDESGDTWFHYLASNKSSKPGEKNVVYEGSMRVSDFYKRGGVGFWNPYKQAQYNSGGSSSSNGTVYLDPMEEIVDQKYKDGGLNTTQQTVLSRFWQMYNKLYEAEKSGAMNDLLMQGEAAGFIDQLSIDWELVEKQQSLGEDLVTLVVQQITDAAAKAYSGNAYNAMLAIIGVLETKLRDESGARINKNEWKQDFLQYLPASSDSLDRKKYKLRNLENYLRSYAKRGSITADEYIPVFTDLYDEYKDKTKNREEGKK